MFVQKKERNSEKKEVYQSQNNNTIWVKMREKREAAFHHNVCAKKKERNSEKMEVYQSQNNSKIWVKMREKREAAFHHNVCAKKKKEIQKRRKCTNRKIIIKFE